MAKCRPAYPQPPPPQIPGYLASTIENTQAKADPKCWQQCQFPEGQNAQSDTLKSLYHSVSILWPGNQGPLTPCPT